jgi:hypothetical protein
MRPAAMSERSSSSELAVRKGAGVANQVRAWEGCTCAGEDLVLVVGLARLVVGLLRITGARMTLGHEFKDECPMHLCHAETEKAV